MPTWKGRSRERRREEGGNPSFSLQLTPSYPSPHSSSHTFGRQSPSSSPHSRTCRHVAMALQGAASASAAADADAPSRHPWIVPSVGCRPSHICHGATDEHRHGKREV
ncbi:unnamed protein product [Closterium sp. NIES-54]